MSERLKKILLVGLFVLVVAGLGYLLYRFFFRPPESILPAPSATIQPGGTLPTAGQGGARQPTQPGTPGSLPSASGTQVVIPPAPATAQASRTKVLSEDTIQALAKSATGGVRGYNSKEGKFYRYLDDGTAVALSDKTFYNVDQVTWGNRTDQAVLTYPDGSKILYDFTNGKQVTLPKHWENFNFSPQDDHIVAKSIGNNSSNHFLVTSNPDGTNAALVEDMGDNQDKVHTSWSPNNQIVAYSFTGDHIGFDEQSIIMVGQHQENFKGLVVPGRGFVPNWSPNGNNILYSVHTSADGYRPSLWVSGAVGDNINANRTNLSINTWADKCAWQSETSLICAVPQSLGQGAGLQRELSDHIPDDIYKIDLSTGQKINLGAPDGKPTIHQMTISPDGKSMYFNDTDTGKLVRFAL